MAERSRAFQKSHPLRDVLSAGPAIVFLWRITPEFPVEFVSESIRQLGYTPDELLSGAVSWPGITHPEDEKRLRSEVEGLFRDGIDTFSQQYRIRDKDGDYHWMNDWNRVLRNEDGEPTHVEALVLDVTERVRVEKTYESLVDNSLQGIAVFQEGRVVFANEALAEMTGYTVDELLAFSPGEGEKRVVHPDDLLWVHKRHLARLRGEPAPSAYEMRIVHKNGETRWMNVYAVLATHEGQPAVQAAFVDISARKQVDEELREREANFRAVAENASEGIAIIGSDGAFLFANPCLADMLRTDVNSLIGKDISNFVAEREQARASVYSRIRSAGATMTDATPFEVTVCAVDGREILMSINMAAVTWRGQQATIALVRDITERRRLEREIVEIGHREQREIGQELHDTLGQTLAGAVFISKALESSLGQKHSELQGTATALRSAVEQALRECRDISHGTLPVHCDAEGLKVELMRVAQRARDLYGIDCQLTCNGDCIISDGAVAAHLYYIAREAVANALRHAEAESIQITLTVGDENGSLRVHNTGPWQEPQEGIHTGMGLQIMRYRTDLIGGRLTVEHSKDEGTTVSVSFSA